MLPSKVLQTLTSRRSPRLLLPMLQQQAYHGQAMHRSPDDGKVHLQSRVNFKELRDNLDYHIRNAQVRKAACDPSKVVDLYEQRTRTTLEIDALRKERNLLSKNAAKDKTFDKDHVRTRGKELKQEIADLEHKLGDIVEGLHHEATLLPNKTHPDAPEGPEENSQILSVHGTKPEFSFTPRDHYDICTALDLADFPSATKIAGSRFVCLKNEAVFMELALVHWSMQNLRARGFNVMLPPDIANVKTIEGCGFTPRSDASQIYTLEHSDLCLAGTSEIALAGMMADTIVKTQDLPIRNAAFSHCFRTEAGHGGRVQRGLYRLHQFSKVEMFSFCTAEQGEAMMNELLAIQIEMFEELGIHFHVVDMATEDLGAPAYRKFDVLAWMPGKQEFGEISSLSNCTDFQARRLGIRHRESKKHPTEYLYTLNGTACAIPRMLISILETNQQEDGSVIIPEVLRPYMGMQERICAKN